MTQGGHPDGGGGEMGMILSHSPVQLLRDISTWSLTSVPVPARILTHEALGEVRIVPPVMVHWKLTLPSDGPTEAQNVRVSLAASTRDGSIAVISHFGCPNG